MLDYAADGTFYYDTVRYIEVPETLWCEVAVSPNAGASWGSFVYAQGGDKQWMTVDRSGGPGRGNVYVLASVDPPGSDPLDVHFSRSTDGGLSWSPAMRINDIGQGVSLDLDFNGIPDECEALIFADGFELGDTSVWLTVSP